MQKSGYAAFMVTGTTDTTITTRPVRSDKTTKDEALADLRRRYGQKARFEVVTPIPADRED